jgi:ribosomal protein S4
MYDDFGTAARCKHPVTSASATSAIAFALTVEEARPLANHSCVRCEDAKIDVCLYMCQPHAPHTVKTWVCLFRHTIRRIRPKSVKKVLFACGNIGKKVGDTIGFIDI